MDISADGISQRYHRYDASSMPEENGTDPEEIHIHLLKLSVMEGNANCLSVFTYASKATPISIF